MRRFALIGFSLLFSFLLLSQAAEAKSYKTKLRSVTKSSELYDLQTWDAKILWHSTIFTGDFRDAYDKEYIKLNYLAGEEKQRWLAKQLDQQKHLWEVLVSFYTKRDYKQFSLGADTFWKIFLTGASGEMIVPITIEEVPVTPLIKVMFPHVSRWSKVYRVLFSKVDLGAKPVLTMRSVVGETKVKWKLKN
ncbi:MAG: hypothetical protein ABIE74_09045 [Pseudomonadota bacterium]